MSRGKAQFEKGYLPNYGDEILEVDAVKAHMRPIRYKLRDEKGRFHLIETILIYFKI